MAMSISPVFLSPATPSELAMYVSSQCVHPTTLIICTTQQEFEYALNDDISREMRLHNPGFPKKEETEPEEAPEDPAAANYTMEEMGSDLEQDMELLDPEPPDGPPARITPLLQPSIHRVAIAKHIRVIFVPSVSHLRAWLTVFPPVSATTVPPPPPAAAPVFSRKTETAPLLLLFGFLDLHRDTSEWSAQGLSNSCATLVEAAREKGMRATVVEPSKDWDGEVRAAEDVLEEEMPMLSGAERRAVRDQDEGSGWVGRTVSVRRVLGRWFGFDDGPWEEGREVTVGDHV